MFSKEMSELVPSCDCLDKVAQKQRAHAYGIPYIDIRVGYYTRFERSTNKASCDNLWLDLNYCPQCGKPYTRLENKKK